MSWEVISLSTFRSCGAILRAPKRRTSVKSIAGGENAGYWPAWVRLTTAGSVTDGRGDPQGLHREGFSQV
ncbi:MAG: hypothetical protein E6I32_13155 [Chloroflexi bacterium]|nr:MAG: hypothetical protein E6I32_13155 [Chloroflexota bacterium]